MRRKLWTVLSAVLAVVAAGALGNEARAMDAEDCQGCHCDSSIVEEGGKYLYVDPLIYSQTAHADEGCPACHAEVSEDHPEDDKRPSRASCADCHDGEAEDLAASAHAGNASCTDCHNPHEVVGVAGVSGLAMNEVCSGCHDPAEVLALHSTWLTQTLVHLKAVPCISCHTASDEYAITFYVEQRTEGDGANKSVRLADRETLSRLAGGRTVVGLLDENSDGIVSMAELQEFIRWARGEDLGLWGMMTPTALKHSYETLDNRWDCSFCHGAGESSVRKAFVAIPGEDGIYRQVPLEYGAVVADIYGTTDFYMIGATRNPALSMAGFGIVGAGLLVPLLHGTVRFLTRKNRREG